MSDIKRSISLYSYQDEYYAGLLDLEGCLRETAKTGAGCPVISHAHGHKPENAQRKGFNDPGNENKQNVLNAAQKAFYRPLVFFVPDKADGNARGNGNKKHAEHAAVHHGAQNIAGDHADNMVKIVRPIA